MPHKWSRDNSEVDVILGICDRTNTAASAFALIKKQFPWTTYDGVANLLRRRGLPSLSVLVAKRLDEAVTPGASSRPIQLEEKDEPPTLKSERFPSLTPPPVPSISVKAVEETPPDRFWVDQEDPEDFHPIIPAVNDWVSKRVLLVPDTHRPYHSRRAFNLMLKAACEIIRPDTVVILGDFGDFYAASQHDKDPKRVGRLKEELDDMGRGLDVLDSLPGVRRKVYCAGNHEWRQARYIHNRAPQLDGLVVSWEEYLNITKRGWEMIPYKRIGVVGNLLVTHETGIGGVYAPKRVLDLAAGMGATDIAFGHTHRLGMAMLGSMNGRPRTGMSCGWLGSHKSVDYVHAIQAFSHYNHGFGYAIADDTGHLVPGLGIIYGKRAHVLGQTVVLEDD